MEKLMYPGMVFNPSDREIISYFLPKMKKGKGILGDFSYLIEVRDMYCTKPSALFEGKKGHRWFLKSNQRFVFSRRKQISQKNANGKRPRRILESQGVGDVGGFWKCSTGDKPIFYGGEKPRVIGYVNTLNFYEYKDEKRSAKDATKTSWLMHEYRLAEDEKFQEWVICKIKDTRRPEEDEGESIWLDQLLGLNQGAGDSYQPSSALPLPLPLAQQPDNFPLQSETSTSVVPLVGYNYSQSESVLNINGAIESYEYHEPREEEDLFMEVDRLLGISNDCEYQRNMLDEEERCNEQVAECLLDDNERDKKLAMIPQSDHVYQPEYSTFKECQAATESTYDDDQEDLFMEVERQLGVSNDEEHQSNKVDELEEPFNEQVAEWLLDENDKDKQLAMLPQSDHVDKKDFTGVVDQPQYSTFEECQAATESTYEYDQEDLFMEVERQLGISNDDEYPFNQQVAEWLLDHNDKDKEKQLAMLPQSDDVEENDISGAMDQLQCSTLEECQAVSLPVKEELCRSQSCTLGASGTTMNDHFDLMADEQDSFEELYHQQLLGMLPFDSRLDQLFSNKEIEEQLATAMLPFDNLPPLVPPDPPF